MFVDYHPRHLLTPVATLKHAKLEVRADGDAPEVSRPKVLMPDFSHRHAVRSGLYVAHQSDADIICADYEPAIRLQMI